MRCKTLSLRSLPLSLALLALVCPPSRGQAQPAAGEAIELRFLNGVYTDLDSDIDPVRQGPLTIRISSPRHQVTVHGNRVWLVPRPDGTLEATVEVDFEGGGDLVAEIEGGGATTPFQDTVTAPRQTVRVTGRTRMEGLAEGYLMTVEEAPPTVTLRIRSELATNLVRVCEALAGFLGLDCSGLEAALSVVTVPLPQPGEQFLVPAALLTPEERAYFDHFLPAAPPTS